MAFTVITAARLLLTPRDGGPLTTRQASLDATDRRVAPSKEASDAGLRPDPFPDRAASLLPGLLTATRTGLTPAGDDELMLDQLLNKHLQLWAHARSGLGVVVQNPGGAMARVIAPGCLEGSGCSSMTVLTMPTP